MDEVWESFKQTKPVSGYYEASNENAIVLCSYGNSASLALRAMADLLDKYEDPLPIATSVAEDEGVYFVTVAISGFDLDS